MDRISTLPYLLMCHILSYIPTKYKVATCILSQRRKHVWTSLRNLSFIDRLCMNLESSTHSTIAGFAEFVHTIFRRPDLTKIAKLFIHCSRPIDFSSLKIWITSALLQFVGQIELYLGQQSCIELLDRIAASETLEVLKFQSDWVIKILLTGYCFPSLKVLHMYLLHPENNFTKNIILNCPRLEDLCIKAILPLAEDKLNFLISSSTLKKLVLTVAVEDLFLIRSTTQWHHNAKSVMSAYYCWRVGTV